MQNRGDKTIIMWLDNIVAVGITSLKKRMSKIRNRDVGGGRFASWETGVQIFVRSYKQRTLKTKVATAVRIALNIENGVTTLYKPSV